MEKLPVEDEFNNFVKWITDNSNISFWDILHLEKLDPNHLKLVFHKDEWGIFKPDQIEPELRKGFWGREQSFDGVLFDMYRNGENKKIETMTELRGKRARLAKDDYAFNFIPYPHGKKTYLLVSAFRVTDAKNRIVKKEDLLEYRPFLGRLVISLYDGLVRPLTLKDANLIKKLTVSELLSIPANKAFPGYDKVKLLYKDLEEKLKTPEWAEKLKAKKGIYVIADQKTGKLYVGSASGKEGIYGRWSDYVNTKGNFKTLLNGEKEIIYPNKGFQKLIKATGSKEHIEQFFQFSILETFDPDMMDSEELKKYILRREGWWKEVLLTKEFGYNGN